MWLAIFITVVASTGNNIGKALQKEAVHSLPRFSLYPATLQQYFKSSLWLSGLALDLVGALLMVAAFALAPVSLVQPVSGVGLVMLAVFAHFHLKERLATEEWVAVATSMLGTIGLGVSSDDSQESDGRSTSLLRVISLGIVFVLLPGALAWFSRWQAKSKRKHVANVKVQATTYGLQAGSCFGMSAASCKAGITLSRQFGWIGIPLGLACSALLSSLGFMLQTLGLKDGNTVAVCTCAAVASMGTGVIVGLLAMGESLPRSSSMKALRLLSWVVTIVGVSALANGKGGFKEVISAIVKLIPHRMRGILGMSRVNVGKDSRLPMTAGHAG